MQLEVLKVFGNIPIYWLVIICFSLYYAIKIINMAVNVVKNFNDKLDVINETKDELMKLAKQMDKNNVGTLAILRYRVRKQSQKAIDYGYMPEEIVDNLTEMFEAYENLDGNGAVKRLYEEAMGLPIKRKEK